MVIRCRTNANFIHIDIEFFIFLINFDMYEARIKLVQSYLSHSTNNI